MAVEGRAPVVPQNHKQVAKLVQTLNTAAGSKKGAGGFKCRKTKYDIKGTKVAVDSWKFNDWDYKRDDLPTYARGLFTVRSDAGDWEIASRGYDKFFNVGELKDTCWENIEQSTTGPYELSVKENGCIIFVSGLEDDTLLVCSKHSTGDRGNPALSHSSWGERWIDNHLEPTGKTRADLARELRALNVTAVAELCDDSFEEHVLAYDEKAAGLYIHGINCNLPDFETWSSSKVHEFADKWGFKKAQYLVKDDIKDVRDFLDKCAETGSFDGRDTEGFVVRCQRKYGTNGPPQDWFFKYKFEEPYLMYRQWREATKALIAGRTPRYKKHHKITEEYLIFARQQFVGNPGLAKEYTQNHGIIKVRDDFLKERGLKGSEIIRMEAEAEGELALKDTTQDVVLCPLATIGCGKTTVAIALTKLFGWAHVQNDNITGKGNRPQRFVAQITANMIEHPVVFADRNNHQKRERKQLIDDIAGMVKETKFVALHYVHDPKHARLPEIRRVTQERVFSRGDNHQTIRTGSKSQGEIVGIMEGFLNRFEPLEPSAEPDNGFDEVIDLDVIEDSRHNLELVVNALHKAFPKLIDTMPSPDELDAAIQYALTDYNPSVKHELSFNSKHKGVETGTQQKLRFALKPEGNDQVSQKAPKLEYFCIRLPLGLVKSALEETFAAQKAVTARFFRQLQVTRRVQAGFHITLIHMSVAKTQPEMWSRFSETWSAARKEQGTLDPLLGQANVALESVVWNGKVMCIAVRIVGQDWQSTNNVAHATVGTRGPEIKPMQSNSLLEQWMAEGCTDANGIQALEVPGKPELLGEVRAVTPATR